MIAKIVHTAMQIVKANVDSQSARLSAELLIDAVAIPMPSARQNTALDGGFEAGGGKVTDLNQMPRDC